MVKIMSRKGESIYHRKDGLWEARYVKAVDFSGKKKYASVYAKSYYEVKEKRQAALESIRIYQTVPVTRNTTVAQIIEEWLEVNKTHLRCSSFQKYQSLYLKHIKKTLGSIPVVYCTTATIQQFCMTKLSEGVSPNTINSVLILLHSSLKHGHRVYNLPMPDIVYFPKEKKLPRVLSTQEQSELTGFLLKDMDTYKFGTLLALYTGLRIGELCALKWDDIEQDRIYVRNTVQRVKKSSDNTTELYIGPPKTQTSVREIPLPPDIIPIINDFRNKSEGKTYVLGHKYLNIVEPRTIQYNFKKYINTLGFENVTFHTLRHSFATRCVEQGFEIKSLSEILGHSSVQITLSRYVHSSFELKYINMKKLSLVV